MKTSRFSTAAVLAVSVLRTAAWEPNQPADLYLGASPDPSRLSSGNDIVVDPVSGKLFVSDSVSGRVFRYSSALKVVPNAPPEAVFGKASATAPVNSTRSALNLTHPRGLAFDAAGRLWVADSNRILRWDNAVTRGSGEPADGVFGSVDFSTLISQSDAASLDTTMHLAVDGSGNLYASCNDRNRVVRFNNAAAKANGAAPEVIFGQSDFTGTGAGLSSTRINKPGEVVIRNTTLWLLDAGNKRVLRLNNAATRTSNASFDAVIGQDSFFSSSSTVLSAGTGMEISSSGTLYFSSSSGSTGFIQTWSGADALSGLLPSADASQSTVFRMDCLALDGAARVWTGTAGGSSESVPVRRLDAFPPVTVSGTLGALKSPAISSAGQAVVDPVSRKVFVSDWDNGRVFRYASVDSLGSGAQAEATLTGLLAPSGMCMDNAGHLFVADTGNSRVVRWNNAATIASGAAISGTLGAYFPNIANEVSMHQPVGVTIDAGGTLWVLDYAGGRALRFDNAASKSGLVPADGLLGQSDYSTTATSNLDGRFYRPSHIQFDGAGNLWVLENDPASNRLMRFNDANHKPIGAVPDVTLRKAVGSNHYYQMFGLAITSDNTLWIAANDTNSAFYVERYDNASALVTGAFPGASGTVNAGDRTTARSLSTDPDGNLWLASGGARRYSRQPSTDIPGSIVGLFGSPASTLQITYASVPGDQYFFESTTDLTAWTVLEARQTSTPRETVVVPAAAGVRRFFRARQISGSP